MKLSPLSENARLQTVLWCPYFGYFFWVYYLEGKFAEIFAIGYEPDFDCVIITARSEVVGPWDPTDDFDILFSLKNCTQTWLWPSRTSQQSNSKSSSYSQIQMDLSRAQDASRFLEGCQATLLTLIQVYSLPKKIIDTSDSWPSNIVRHSYSLASDIFQIEMVASKDASAYKLESLLKLRALSFFVKYK